MLLPYTTDRPPRNPPVAVVCLVLAHFAVYGIVALILAVRGSDAAVLWYAGLSLVPGSIQPHSLVTYAFLHESVFHLSSNMLFLWVFGGSVEDAIGWRRFLTFYIAAVIVSGLLEAVMAALLARAGNVMPIVGASGAISAIVGVFAFRFYRSSIAFIGLPVRIPAIFLLGAVMLGEMAMALLHLTRRDQVFASYAAAHWAHVGGFLFGILWARITRVTGSGRAEYLEQDARQAMEGGSFPSAAHRWEELLTIQPGNLEARAELGRAWLSMGDNEQALPCFEEALKAFLKTGRKTEAAECYATMGDLAQKVPLSPSELLALSGALTDQGQHEPSLRVLDRILKEHRESPEADMARLRSAALHLKVGNSDRARELTEEYLSRNPGTELRSYAEDLLHRAAELDGGRPQG